MFSVLIISDKKDTRELIAMFLRHKGYTAIPVSTCSEANYELENHYVSLIILERSATLLGCDSFMETNKNSGCDIPTIVVSESASLEDMQIAFKNGADDYMVKPVKHRELFFRIEAILRRTKQVYKKSLIIGEAMLDYDSLLISLPIGKKIQDIFLPQKEFHLLYLPLSYPNRIFSRQQIMNEIWDFDSESNEKTVDVHINRLRKKLKNNKDFEIVTIRNVGYKATIIRKPKKEG